jgi:hypothetical protein
VQSTVAPERPVRELCHAHTTAGLRQLSEHVEVGQGQTGHSFEIHLELANQGGMRPQQCPPGTQSAPARKLIRNQPVE